MFLSIKDLSIYLRIKPSTLYAWVAQGKIPHVKIHGLIRFQKEEVDRWVESFRKEPPKLPSIYSAGRDPRDIDSLIARAKQQVYNTPQQETRPRQGLKGGG